MFIVIRVGRQKAEGEGQEGRRRVSIGCKREKEGEQTDSGLKDGAQYRDGGGRLKEKVYEGSRGD